MRIALPCLLALALCGCGNYTPFLYKTDVIQGNIFSDADIARIQPGMSRAEVERLLGTPQLTDPFHKDSSSTTPLTTPSPTSKTKTSPQNKRKTS